MNEKKFLRPEQASKLLNVTVRTLEKWETSGKINCIRTKVGHRRFPFDEIIELKESNKRESKPTIRFDEKQQESIVYARVSSYSQKKDLERQIGLLQTQFPNYKVISDVGSGINWRRKGFNSIIDSAIKGNIKSLVVTHRDRLCRFGFELVERIIREYSNGEIVVLNSEKTSPEKELIDDLISIITIFSSRVYGLRSNSIKKKIKQARIQKENKEGNREEKLENNQN